MEANVEEALKARETAEKRFAERDYAGAKRYAVKAKTLNPKLEGISQMVATFEVYIASNIRNNGEVDYYSVLGLKPTADNDTVKKQYRKMAVLLHPDKNKTVGADGAFKLLSEAWTLLSDTYKRSCYDLKRNKQLSSCVVQTNLFSPHASGVAGYTSHPNSTTIHGLDTFWTVCTSCKVQYEYLRKYVNKRLSCKNCRATFVAVETGAAPLNGSFPYSSWTYPHSGSYGSHHGHVYDGMAYVPTPTTLYQGNGLQSSHAYDYAPNLSFQWNSLSDYGSGRTNGVYADPGLSVKGNVHIAKGTRKRAIGVVVPCPNSNISVAHNGSHLTKSGRPDKRRKVVVGASFRNGSEDKVVNSASEVGFSNGSTETDPKKSSPCEGLVRQNSTAHAFDVRKLLIDKAKNSIRKKLEDIKLSIEATLAAAAAPQENLKDQAVVGGMKLEKTDLDVSCSQIKQSKVESVSITVPDPDFHDFDKDRSEECFKPKQIWAIYDEDDGMPRLYCLIRQVVSTSPFKIHISYLNSKMDSEFVAVNWIESGFTKSCGQFRAWSSDIVDQVNIFSHLLKGEKPGRGGSIRIYPKRGEIWAIYKNWSADWTKSTPKIVRHQYEMVEILENYSEEIGVCVSPLIKLTGFKTVYQKNPSESAIQLIPRNEMVRFSHQVPSWPLGGEGSSFPEKCWDLDPAATPDELLNSDPKDLE